MMFKTSYTYMLCMFCLTLTPLADAALQEFPKGENVSEVDDGSPEEFLTIMDARLAKLVRKAKLDEEKEEMEEDIQMKQRGQSVQDAGLAELDRMAELDEGDKEMEEEKQMEKRGGSAKVWLKNANTAWKWKRVERVLPTRGEIAAIAKVNGGLTYISGSRTYDNVRQRGNGPYNVWFRDRRNGHWYVRIPKNGYGVTFMVPCGSEIYFNGHNNRVRTGSGAHTSWAELSFSYLSGGWGMNNGIRLRLQGYRYGNSREDGSDMQLVDDIFKYVGKGVDIAGKISVIVARHSKG